MIIQYCFYVGHHQVGVPRRAKEEVKVGAEVPTRVNLRDPNTNVHLEKLGLQ